jgi:ribonuclease Z
MQAQQANSAVPSIKVTLLGTASGPVVRLNRYQTTTLVDAGGERFLFDCGRGVLLRMLEAGIPIESVSRLFLTHLHSDHVVDIPDLLLTPWAFRTPRKVPLEVWGPAGTEDMMDHLQKAFAFDIHIRRDVDEHFSPEGIKVISHDVIEGTVYEKNGVKITSFLVDHGPVKPAYGYRVDYAGHSVALSGDTRPSDNLVRFAKGVDVLIHEAMDPDSFRALRAGFNTQQTESIIAHHTTPEQAGEIFTKVKPKLAVYSHTEGIPILVTKARKTYSGPLEMGEDLMTITIGENVEVHRPHGTDIK